MIIEIGDVKKNKARKVDARTSKTQTSMNSAGKPMNQIITTLNTVYLARHFHDQQGGIVCSILTISAVP